MILYGYVKDYMYASDGTLMIRTRIPSIHGPWSELEYNGRRGRNYVKDADLPYYQSVLLPHLPTNGEVVMLASTSEGKKEFVIIGLTGGSYFTGTTNLG